MDNHTDSSNGLMKPVDEIIRGDTSGMAGEIDNCFWDWWLKRAQHVCTPMSKVDTARRAWLAGVLFGMREAEKDTHSITGMGQGVVAGY